MILNKAQAGVHFFAKEMVSLDETDVYPLLSLDNIFL
jgi:hypothetical protein